MALSRLSWLQMASAPPLPYFSWAYAPTIAVFQYGSQLWV